MDNRTGMFSWSKSGCLQVNSKGLEFSCHGPSPDQASTIVLLHEGLGCVELWRDFPQALSQATDCGVFAYSRAGYGQSDLADLPRPLDYMTREAVDVLPVVLDAIGIRRGILMGHSDGATIAAIYAGTVTDQRIQATILVAPHFFVESYGLAEISAAREQFNTSDMRTRMGRYHRDPENTFRGWNDAWLHPEFKHWNVGNVIDHFRVPTLAIQGRQDQYGTLAQITEIETRAHAPVETMIIENCGHNPHKEQAAEVLAGVSGFVSRLGHTAQS